MSSPSDRLRPRLPWWEATFYAILAGFNVVCIVVLDGGLANVASALFIGGIAWWRARSHARHLERMGRLRRWEVRP